MKANEIATDILDNYDKISYEKLRLEALKNLIKDEYDRIKKEMYDNNEEFELLNINGIILQERKRTNYTWSPAFQQELIDCGMAHLVLKHGNKMSERFNLQEFELPKKPENQTLHFSPRKNPTQVELIEEKLNGEFQTISHLTFEEKAELYIRYKKKFDLKMDQYDINKKKLIAAMKEEKIEKVGNEKGSFSIKDEETKYDFAKMYMKSFEEIVVIATNGEKSYDLLTDEPTPTSILESHLHNAEIIKKRLGERKLSILKENLGDNFYFVKGYRTEDNILSRFPISSGKIEEAIDNGYIDYTVLKTERMIESMDDITLVFEIVTEDSQQKRMSTFYDNFMRKALKRSGYYDNYAS